MARPLRIQFEGAWYHVMNRGASHKKIFFNNDNRTHFLNLLGEITKIYGIEIHTYQRVKLNALLIKEVENIVFLMRKNLKYISEIKS